MSSNEREQNLGFALIVHIHLNTTCFIMGSMTPIMPTVIHAVMQQSFHDREDQRTYQSLITVQFRWKLNPIYYRAPVLGGSERKPTHVVRYAKAPWIQSKPQVTLKKNAPATLKGWRWHRSWSGRYSIAINKRVAMDPWNMRATNS
jgi:hypothetical protein